jgi:hypothetical protein
MVEPPNARCSVLGVRCSVLISDSSAKGVRKQIVSSGADEEQVKEHRKAIDAIVGAPNWR